MELLLADPDGNDLRLWTMRLYSEGGSKDTRAEQTHRNQRHKQPPQDHDLVLY